MSAATSRKGAGAPGADLRADLRLAPEALDRLMPMHLVLNETGEITGIGPTLKKLDPDGQWLGRRFFEVFVVRRPGGLRSPADLQARAGQRIYLAARSGAFAGLRGTAFPLGGGGLILNLSFGVTVLDAVRRLQLTEADFAPTDLAIELLYMVEVKSALMEDLRHLNTRLEGAKSLAEEEAQSDPLTGLRNRRAVNARLETLILSHTPFALMLMDLDYFKKVNDELGHAAGDFILCHVADVLHQEMREGDTLGRTGGDEFVIILPGVKSANRLKAVAERVIARISTPISFEGQSCQISASIGMSVSRHYMQPSLNEMLADADMALYASKRAGRGQARLFRAANAPGGGGVKAS